MSDPTPKFDEHDKPLTRVDGAMILAVVLRPRELAVMFTAAELVAAHDRTLEHLDMPGQDRAIPNAAIPILLDALDIHAKRGAADG